MLTLGRKALVLLCATAFASGCSCHLPVPVVTSTREPMNLNTHSFEVRMFKPAEPSANVLIVYATGDGGWLGLGSDVFNWLKSWNFPVVGFSSRGYLKNLSYISDNVTTTPARVSEDYTRVVGFAESRLGLPSTTPVILVGLSRGAGLAVVAGGEGRLDPFLAGVLAIALTKEEEHVVRHRIRLPSGISLNMMRDLQIQTYSYLNRISKLPIIVIQSTRDHYLPAEKARELFGPDTSLRRLRPIDAANHSFGHACPELYRETHSGVEWILRQVR